MTANELLPCPFCGAEPLVENICDQVFVSCPTVHLEPIVHSCGALQMGIDRWNRRAPLTRAALAASPLVQEIVAEAVQWQPIETAPKDETYHVRGLWVHSSKTGERLYWESIAGYVADDGDFVDHDSNAPWRAEDYTHWMPLPAPPAAIRARGETPSSSPVAVSIAPETDAKPQGRWCWACLRHEVQADGWCRKCGGMTGQPQEKGE